MKSYYKLKHLPEVIPTALPSFWNVSENKQIVEGKIHKSLEIEPTETMGGMNYKLIIAGGGYNKARCTDKLIKAMTLLPENYILVFTGMNSDSKKLDEFKLKTEIRGIAHRIVNLGYLEYNELLTLFSISDAGVLLYKNDGIGNFYQCPGRLTEYLNAGLKFITSNFTGLELLCCKYNIGIPVNPESTKEIAKGLIELCERDSKKLDLDRFRLKELSRTLFSYNNQAEKLYEFIIDNHKMNG